MRGQANEVKFNQPIVWKSKKAEYDAVYNAGP